MAADAWKAYNSFRRDVALKLINLSTETLKVALFTAAANVANATRVTFADLTGELAAGNGYTAGGQVVAGTWTMAAAVCTLDVADASWTASGGPLVFRYAVLYDVTAGNRLVAWSLLDNTPADVNLSDGGSFSLQIHASGVLTLTGM